MTPIIKINNLKKSYEMGNIKALNDINLEIEKGDFVSIIGQSGSGKTTLLNMIGALDIADEGSVEVSGYNLNKMKNLNKFRSIEVGFIFQLHNLIPNLSWHCLNFY
ncbi:MAG: Pseudogene of ABC transporter ATP-binding protein [Methanobrevibacter sp. CfCl-M3]